VTIDTSAPTTHSIDYVVTNPAAMALIPAADRATADPSSLSRAIPETYPPLDEEWVKTFEEFQAG